MDWAKGDKREWKSEVMGRSMCLNEQAAPAIVLTVGVIDATAMFPTQSNRGNYHADIVGLFSPMPLQQNFITRHQTLSSRSPSTFTSSFRFQSLSLGFSLAKHIL